MWDVLQLVMGGQLLAFFVLRLAYEPSNPSSVVLHESGFFRVTMSAVALGQVILLIGLVFNPEAFDFAVTPLPMFLRWAGSGLGLFTLGFLAWTYRVLGSNYHSVLHLDDNQVLITSGPYRYIRHPIYVALFGIFFSFYLQSANMLVLLLGTGGLSVLLYTRIPKEEALLLKHFGRSYRSYMVQTKRFGL